MGTKWSCAFQLEKSNKNKMGIKVVKIPSKIERYNPDYDDNSYRANSSRPTKIECNNLVLRLFKIFVHLLKLNYITCW